MVAARRDTYRIFFIPQKNINMGKKLVLAIALLMASFQISAQCDCNSNPKVWSTSIVHPVPNFGSVTHTYTVKYFDCGGVIRVYDILFKTSRLGFDDRLVFANGMEHFLQSLKPNIPIIQLQGECGRWAPSGGQIGSGESSYPTTYGLVFCTDENSTCCQMANFDMGQFLGTHPSCPNPNLSNCFLICQP